MLRTPKNFIFSFRFVPIFDFPRTCCKKCYCLLFSGEKVTKNFSPKKGSIRKKNVTRFLRRGQRRGQEEGRKKGARLSRTRLVFPPAPCPGMISEFSQGSHCSKKNCYHFFARSSRIGTVLRGKVLSNFLTDKSFRIMKTERFTGWTGNFIKLRPDLEYCFSLVRTQCKNLFLCIERFKKSQLTN